MACDIAIAAESAQLGFPEIARGFVPAMVMTMLRRSVGEKHAFDLDGTGRTVTATEAMAMGLVSRVVADGPPAEVLPTFTAEMARIGERDADTDLAR